MVIVGKVGGVYFNPDSGGGKGTDKLATNTSEGISLAPIDDANLYREIFGNLFTIICRQEAVGPPPLQVSIFPEYYTFNVTLDGARTTTKERPPEALGKILRTTNTTISMLPAMAKKGWLEVPKRLIERDIINSDDDFQGKDEDLDFVLRNFRSILTVFNSINLGKIQDQHQSVVVGKLVLIPRATKGSDSINYLILHGKTLEVDHPDARALKEKTIIMTKQQIMAKALEVTCGNTV